MEKGKQILTSYNIGKIVENDKSKFRYSFKEKDLGENLKESKNCYKNNRGDVILNRNGQRYLSKSTEECKYYDENKYDINMALNETSDYAVKNLSYIINSKRILGLLEEAPNYESFYITITSEDDHYGNYELEPLWVDIFSYVNNLLTNCPSELLKIKDIANLYKDHERKNGAFTPDEEKEFFKAIIRDEKLNFPTFWYIKENPHVIENMRIAKYKDIDSDSCNKKTELNVVASIINNDLDNLSNEKIENVGYILARGRTKHIDLEKLRDKINSKIKSNNIISKTDLIQFKAIFIDKENQEEFEMLIDEIVTENNNDIDEIEITMIDKDGQRVKVKTREKNILDNYIQIPLDKNTKRIAKLKNIILSTEI